jgi:arginine deiminase
MTPDNIVAHCTNEHGVLGPNPDYLLFDDLVLLSRLRKEHDQIVQVLQATCGRDQTLEVRDLLRTLLHNQDVREQVIGESIAIDERCWGQSVSKSDRTRLMDLDAHNLVKALTRGTLADGSRILRWPVPNLIFTRDLAAIVGDQVVLTYARKHARRREMAITRALFQHHPMWEGVRVVDIGSTVSDPAIEGGDILVLGPNHVAIGVSERTTEESARAAASALLQNDIEVVYLVSIQAHRATMHLDTIFTLVDHNQCLVYSPLVAQKGALQIASMDRQGGTHERMGSLLDVLAQDGLRLEPILCGGDNPSHQSREQWSDGANAFALAPGKILLYARNERTLTQLNHHGFEVITPEAFCRNATLLLNQPERRLVVAIEGSELSRGRGGPRCLTLPLRRDP